MGELLCHLLGDYLLQNRWMAVRKLQSLPIAFLHAALYSLPFVLLRPNPAALVWICLTHALIDRHNVARYVVWGKEHLAPSAWWPDDFENCPTGNDPSVHLYLSAWLRILVDNTLHLAINHLSLTIFA